MIELINLVCATQIESLYFRLLNLTKEYFVSSLGRKLFLRLQHLSEKQIKPDYSILISQVTPSEEKTLYKISKELEPEKWEDYFKLLKEAYHNRLINDASHKCISNIPVDQKIKLLSDTTLNLLGREKEHRVYSIGEVLENMSLKQPDTGIPLGLEKVDEYLGNLHKGDYFVVAGRPGMGKTAFLIDIHVKASYKKKLPTILFTAEGNKEQIAQRFWANVAKVPYSRFRRNEFTDPQLKDLKKAKERIIKCPFNIGVFPEFTVNFVDNYIRAKKQEYDLAFVSIDHLQRMAGGEDTAMVTKNSGALMNLALYHNIPFVVASQLKRAINPEQKKVRPTLEDLRQSGAIEQDATAVMFLWRESYYNEKLRGKDLSGKTDKDDDKPLGNTDMELIFEKNRYGEMGTITVIYNLKTQIFEDK